VTNHPSRSRARLAEYGARLRTVDEQTVLVEMTDPNDGSMSRYQYRRLDDGIERRILAHDGSPFRDTGSPWEPLSRNEIAALRAVRGEYHPILDPLGL